MAGLQTDTAEFAGLGEAKKHEYEYEKSHVVSEEGDEPDGIHDGLEFPTEDERLMLRRVPDKVPWGAYCEFCVYRL